MGAIEIRPGGNGRRDLSSTIYAFIHAQRQTSRIRLARALGLSKASVTGGVATLLEAGLVKEAGKLPETHGRGPKEVMLEIEPRARLVLGAQIGDEHCTVVATDLYAAIDERVTVPIHGTTSGDALRAIAMGVGEIRSRTTIPILGLGVGVPGVVDAAGRQVTQSLGHHWSNVPLAAELEAQLGLSVQLANRAKVAALGEYWIRATSGTDSLVYVHMGTGIVAGIVIGGVLLMGRDGLAGELGHVSMVTDGPPCDCGSRGCLQTLASTSAIVGEIRRLARTPATLRLVQQINGGPESAALEYVAKAASAGDAVATDALANAALYLGVAIANLVNLYNPQAVVLGGPLIRISEEVRSAIVREVQFRSLRAALNDLPIVVSAMPGEEAGAIGAAALFLEHLPEYLEILETTQSRSPV